MDLEVWGKRTLRCHKDLSWAMSCLPFLDISHENVDAISVIHEKTVIELRFGIIPMGQGNGLNLTRTHVILLQVFT